MCLYICICICICICVYIYKYIFVHPHTSTFRRADREDLHNQTTLFLSQTISESDLSLTKSLSGEHR